MIVNEKNHSVSGEAYDWASYMKKRFEDGYHRVSVFNEKEKEKLEFTISKKMLVTT